MRSWWSLCVVVVLAEYDGSRLDGSLVRELSHSPCVRMFHSAGDIGCIGTKRGGSQFPLLPALNLLAAGPLASILYEQPVTAVIEADSFNSTVVAALAATSRLGALIVLADRGTPDFAHGKYSPDVTTPQVRFAEAICGVRADCRGESRVAPSHFEHTETTLASCAGQRDAAGALRRRRGV